MRTAIVLIATVLMLANTAVRSEETDVMVRARAVDAKFIGSGVGGMEVVITDAESGELLDRGKITGGTGDTSKLMKTPAERGMRLSTDGTAGYLATLDLDKPTRVDIRVEGPLDGGENIQEARKTTWVLPGNDLRGDGIVFNMPGLIVDGEFASEGNDRRLTASVMMLCGCPITKGGLWDSDNFEVLAHAMKDGEPLETLTLSFTGNTGEFAWQGRPPEGTDRIVIRAEQTTTANSGVATVVP